MNIQPTSNPIVQLQGDFLALDPAIRAQVQAEAAQLQSRYASEPLGFRVRIQEELDPVHGHRVLCEVVPTLADGRQVMVRERRKKAPEAVSAVFASLRMQLRRVLRRMPREPGAPVTGLRAAGS